MTDRVSDSQERETSVMTPWAMPVLGEVLDKGEGSGVGSSEEMQLK